MTKTNLTAQVNILINAPVQRVWNALTDPKLVKKYMFDTNVSSDWKQGSEIKWRGEWQGKQYEDKGRIIEIATNKKLVYTHFSPLTGKPDKPENYHNVRIELKDMVTQTMLSLSQDNNESESAKEHSEKNWEIVLNGLKDIVEMGAE